MALIAPSSCQQSHHAHQARDIARGYYPVAEGQGDDELKQHVVNSRVWIIAVEQRHPSCIGTQLESINRTSSSTSLRTSSNVSATRCFGTGHRRPCATQRQFDEFAPRDPFPFSCHDKIGMNTMQCETPFTKPSSHF
eukprot:2521223-Rhodomonas_salina.2